MNFIFWWGEGGGGGGAAGARHREVSSVWGDSDFVAIIPRAHSSKQGEDLGNVPRLPLQSQTNQLGVRL